MKYPTKTDIDQAADRLAGVVEKTPLQLNKRLSAKYGAKVYLKREDLQEVRSFKIRGAFNKISSLTLEEKQKGVVCASAGNHAQGFAWSCSHLKIKGVVFMPSISPSQKVERVHHFGGEYVKVVLTGTTVDDALAAARQYEKETGAVFVHPFDDEKVIEGQGTVGKEIYEKLEGNVDVVVACLGGGGLISGVSTYLKELNPEIKIYGAEPLGAAEMYASLQAGKVIVLDKIDTFVDGAALRTTGQINYDICKKNVEDIKVVPEGRVCSEMVDLYQNEGIVVEPAGALAVSALDQIQNEIKGKTVVCIISGGNNDILRYPEVLERSLVYKGLKHYFIVEFAQKPGQLRTFLERALGPNDDISRFEYIKKTNKEKGPALVGIELKNKEDFAPLMQRMEALGFNFTHLTSDDMLYQFLI